jgi:hypothetical protein
VDLFKNVLNKKPIEKLCKLSEASSVELKRIKRECDDIISTDKNLSVKLNFSEWCMGGGGGGRFFSPGWGPERCSTRELTQTGF